MRTTHLMLNLPALNISVENLTAYILIGKMSIISQTTLPTAKLLKEGHREIL